MINWTFIAPLAQSIAVRIAVFIPVAGYIIIYGDAFSGLFSFDERLTKSGAIFTPRERALCLYFGGLFLMGAFIVFRLSAPIEIRRHPHSIDFVDEVLRVRSSETINNITEAWALTGESRNRRLHHAGLHFFKTLGIIFEDSRRRLSDTPDRIEPVIHVMSLGEDASFAVSEFFSRLQQETLAIYKDLEADMSAKTRIKHMISAMTAQGFGGVLWEEKNHTALSDFLTAYFKMIDRRISLGKILAVILLAIGGIIFCYLLSKLFFALSPQVMRSLLLHKIDPNRCLAHSVSAKGCSAGNCIHKQPLAAAIARRAAARSSSRRASRSGA